MCHSLRRYRDSAIGCVPCCSSRGLAAENFDAVPVRVRGELSGRRELPVLVKKVFEGIAVAILRVGSRRGGVL